MTSSPKRPWFRFHLLTAVLMMVAAGGFVGLNSIVFSDNLLRWQGWPLSYRCEFAVLEGPYFQYAGISILELVTNVGVGIGGVAALWFFSEFIVRRREGRKT